MNISSLLGGLGGGGGGGQELGRSSSEQNLGDDTYGGSAGTGWVAVVVIGLVALFAFLGIVKLAKS